MSVFPDIINIIICENYTGNPIPNIATKIRLFANRKNDYNFILPLSDETGNITVTKDWLKEEIKKEQALFIMDYQSGLDDCKSQIEISVLDIESLSRAINAMYIYQEYTGITDTEIKRYKESQNSRFFSWANIIKLNDNSKLDINIYLKSRY
ncbi:MAG: hypothetical protein QME45_09025 [Clostridiales bacterium]|nr:hypothetical protein [Clostridiales bacterium]